MNFNITDRLTVELLNGTPNAMCCCTEILTFYLFTHFTSNTNRVFLSFGYRWNYNKLFRVCLCMSDETCQSSILIFCNNSASQLIHTLLFIDFSVLCPNYILTRIYINIITVTYLILCVLWVFRCAQQHNIIKIIKLCIRLLCCHFRFNLSGWTFIIFISNKFCIRKLWMHTFSSRFSFHTTPSPISSTSTSTTQII